MVLALVMTLSLAVSANAFKDDKSISDDYAEAVAVLNGMGVFKGYEDGSFQPKGDITRAEVATIIYRIYTADVAKNDKSSLYATYNKFSDMAGASWAAGYIGYCANAELVKGYPDGTFKPSGKVTGYEVLAMILRAVGYDKNGEFSGADWALHVAQTAQQAGVLKNVKGVDLNAAASRELVAELLFRGIQASTVTYTPAFGYVTDKVIGAASSTIGVKNFKLDSADAADKWGRPATKWTYSTGDKSTLVVDKPIKTYTTKVSECDIAKDAGQTADKTYKLVVNGANESNITVQRLDTVTKLGAQGRLTEVYDDVIVMIDTFLAKVTDNVEAKFDKNTHMTAPYMLKLDVYDNDNGAASPVVLTDEDAAYTYAVGDFILINAYTDKNGTTSTAAGNVAKSSIYSVATNVADYAEIVGKADALEGAQTVIWYNAEKHTVNGTVYDDASEFNHDDANTNIGNYTWYFDSYGNLIGAFEIATAYNYGVITKMWFAGDSSNGSGKTMAEVTYMDKTTNVVTVASVDILTADTTDTTKTHAYTPVYGYGVGTSAYGNAMQFDSTNWTLPVATNANVNADMDDLTGSSSSNIIDGHLFRMQTLSDGSVAFVLVNNGTTAVKPTHTTVTSTITNKYAWIGNVKVDTETMFLVGTENATTGVYSYETYKGLNEIPSFTKSAVVVDYVLDATTGVAKYVYVVGTPDSAQSSDYVLITNDSYTANLKTAANGVQYWEVNLNTLEGLVTVKTQNADVKNLLTNAANINKLYYLTYTDGYVANVADVKEVTTSHQVFDAKKPEIAAVKASGTTTYLNGVVETTINGSQDIRFNVTASTVVVGALSADMTDKIVYVTFDMNNHNVEKIWVVDAAATVPSVYPYYVKSATVATINTPRQYDSVSAATASILTWSSSDGHAANNTLKVSVKWQKWNGSTYADYTEPYFLEGAYRAIVTLTTDNASNTYPYVINENTVITYEGATVVNGFAVEVGYIH